MPRKKYEPTPISYWEATSDASSRTEMTTTFTTLSSIGVDAYDSLKSEYDHVMNNKIHSQKVTSREDPFTREERWIMAGGDALYSEFEAPTSFPSVVQEVPPSIWHPIYRIFRVVKNIIFSIIYRKVYP